MATKADGPTSEQAYQILKANIAKLINELQPDDICDGLFSGGVVTDEEYKFATNVERKTKDRVRKLLYSALQKIKSNYEHFQTLCTTLEESDSSTAQQWAEKLKDELTQLHVRQSQLQSDDKDVLMISHLKTLKERLLVVHKGILESDDNLDAKHDIMREFIATFVRNSLESSAERAVYKQLYKLCYEENLIPSKLYDWTFEVFKEITQLKQDSSELIQNESPSLFGEITRKGLSAHVVNSCLLLCNMISYYNHSNYTSFLAQHDHSFEEVSFSIDPPRHFKNEAHVERYAIARNKFKKEVYVAFLGEPSIASWKEKYSTFEKGISVQASRIPVHFFVEQIEDGYNIILTGFSFGGLLALAVYMSVWNQACLRQADLVEYVTCITFGLPLIPIEWFDKTVESIPKMKENSYFFIMKDDLFSRLLQYGELSDKESKGNGEAKLPGKVGAIIAAQLIEYWNKVNKKDKKAKAERIDISKLRDILQEKSLSRAQDAKVYGTCRFLYRDSLKDTSSYNMSQLAPKAALDVLKFPNVEELDQLSRPEDLIANHSLDLYEKTLVKFFPKDISKRSKSSIEQVSILKPSVSSIKFYRHGDEIALVLEGENLWFCSNIRITSTDKSSTKRIPASEAVATCHSVNFNYTPEHESDLLIDRGKPKEKEKFVDIVLYTHFASPMHTNNVPATCMGEYHISYRQRQLAKCTPAEVIQLSFLSALLECTSDDRPSHRYETICRFLEDIVNVVPIESIFFAIAFGSDENSWKCAEAFMSTDVTIRPSLHLSSSLELAVMRLLLGIPPNILDVLGRQAVSDNIRLQLQASMHKMPPLLPAVVFDSRNEGIVVSAHKANISADNSMNLSEATNTVEYKRDLRQFLQHSDNSSAIISKLQKLRDRSMDLCRQHSMQKGSPPRVISNRNIQDLYPAKVEGDAASTCKLKAPISVLSSGREKLLTLQKNAAEEIFGFLAEGDDPREFHNEEMISVIDNIINNELAICVSMLGGFMEHQIKVPLVDSPLDTAEILQTTEAHPAVGVWTLFSLKMIDFQKMLQNKKGKAMIVKVEKYIRSILSKSSQSRPEELYAGRLEFLMQCLDSSVRCSTHYISYSLEVQLARLCKKHNIKVTTGVKELTKNWDTFFKGNILYHVVEHYRPVVARWIVWCLNIHCLREELSSHTTVGVMGLSNSGKSCLVRNLFKLKVIAGTMNMQRTTIPFLYNLDGKIDGLSVIDFPGVDDKDKNVVKVSKSLLQISQLIVLVIEYKRCNTEAACKWIDILREAGVPVLICLTHGDKLYASTCITENGERWSNDHAKRFLAQELKNIKKKLNPLPSWTVKLYSFNQDSDSTLNDAEGRSTLADVGILSCNDVGKWIESELRTCMDQGELADRLNKFMSSENTTTSAKRKKTKGDLPEIRGLNILDETQFHIFQNGTTFTWKEHGLKITFPPNSISDDICPVYVKVISSGDYKLPDDSLLVSSLYWLYCPKKFLKNIQVEIQHCSVPSKENVLSFIHGRCDQELPYSFKQKSGLFSLDSKEGSISLQSFCILGIISSWLMPPSPSIRDSPTLPNQIHPKRKLCYVVKVFAKCFDSRSCKFELFFMKDLQTFHFMINETYRSDDGWVFDIQEPFLLENSCENISVEVLEQLRLNGWKCTMKNSGNILRDILELSQVNSTPRCCLEFEWTNNNTNPVPIECPVLIKGPIGSPQLTLTVPIKSSGTQADTQSQTGDCHKGEQSLSANDAVKLLRRAGFNFFSSFSSLLVELEIDTDHKRMLHEQARQAMSGDYQMATEEAIDWWIKNKDSSLRKFIEVVRKCEENTATKLLNII